MIFLGLKCSFLLLSLMCILALQYSKGLTDGLYQAREVVNMDHWSQFPPQNPLLVDILALAYLFLTKVCILASALLIYVFLTALRIPVRFQHTIKRTKIEGQTNLRLYLKRILNFWPPGRSLNYLFCWRYSWVNSFILDEKRRYDVIDLIL